MSGKLCIDCRTPCGRGSRGRCKPCGYRARRKDQTEPLTNCIDCAGPISRQSRSGRCRPCATRAVNNDPAIRVRQAEAIRRKFADDPAHRAKMVAVIKKNAAVALQKPERREALRVRGKEMYRIHLSRPDVRERNLAAVQANRWKITEKRLGWCPESYRDQYRRLTVGKRFTAAEARRIIENAIAAAKRKPKTFEDQLRAVEQGRARLVAAPPKADNGPTITLGGVASGWAA